MSLLREKNPFAHFPVTFSGWGLTHFGHAATLYTHVCPLSLCSEFQKVPMPQSWFEKQDKDQAGGGGREGVAGGLQGYKPIDI